MAWYTSKTFAIVVLAVLSGVFAALWFYDRRRVKHNAQVIAKSVINMTMALHNAFIGPKSPAKVREDALRAKHELFKVVEVLEPDLSHDNGRALHGYITNIEIGGEGGANRWV